jgi:hypothetical protein
MNRKVSIPISRQLIKYPITPNMVSLFTLGVSVLAGALFALGDRANMLEGAMLSVFASILDGRDGEVARLTFQESAFGCWRETVCDYLLCLHLCRDDDRAVGERPGLQILGHVALLWSTDEFPDHAEPRHLFRRMTGNRHPEYRKAEVFAGDRRASSVFV